MKKRVSTIQELYNFLQVHMVTKGEFNEFKEESREKLKKLVTKKEFEKFKDDVLSRIDKFIVLHEKLETEITSLRSQYNRLEERIIKLEARLA